MTPSPAPNYLPILRLCVTMAAIPAPARPYQLETVKLSITSHIEWLFLCHDYCPRAVEFLFNISCPCARQWRKSTVTCVCVCVCVLECGKVSTASTMLTQITICGFRSEVIEFGFSYFRFFFVLLDASLIWNLSLALFIVWFRNYYFTIYKEFLNI